MTEQEKRNKLADAIEKEFENLPDTNMFGEDKNHVDHELSMKFLRTGEYEEDDEYLDGELPELMSLVDCDGDLRDYYDDYEIV